MRAHLSEYLLLLWLLYGLYEGWPGLLHDEVVRLEDGPLGEGEGLGREAAPAATRRLLDQVHRRLLQSRHPHLYTTHFTHAFQVTKLINLFFNDKQFSDPDPGGQNDPQNRKKLR
jgi:hypothetical protein